MQDRILRRLNRKERKERRDSGQKERGLALAAGRVLRPGKFAHLEVKGAEIDEQTVFKTGGLQGAHKDWRSFIGFPLRSLRSLRMRKVPCYSANGRAPAELRPPRHSADDAGNVSRNNP